MPNITSGANIAGTDLPPAAYDADDTLLLNLENLTYAVGSPEVGTTFVAPTSGRVRLTVGAGVRDSSGIDRLFVSPQVFKGASSSGTEVLAPSVTSRGVGSTEDSTEFHYCSRTSLLTGLTPGATYYARVMHVVSPAAAAANKTADIGFRDITVIPVP